jgi:hypothetical protein
MILEILYALLIKEDNQGCIALAMNTGNHWRTKHIDIKYHFTRDQDKAHNVEIRYTYVYIDQVPEILNVNAF